MGIKLLDPLAKSLRLRIVFLLMVCLIPTTLGGIYWLDAYTEARLIELAKEDLVARSRLMAELIKRLDRERRFDAAFLAADPAVTTFDPVKSQALIQDFADFHHWEGIFAIFNQDGKLISESHPGTFQHLDKVPTWFQEVQKRGGAVNRLAQASTVNESQDCLIMPIKDPTSKAQTGILIECIPLAGISRFVYELGQSINFDRIVFVNNDGWVYVDTMDRDYTKLENRKNSPIIANLLNGEEGIKYTNGMFVYSLPIKFRSEKTWGLILANDESSIQNAIADVNKVGSLGVLVMTIIVCYSSWVIIHRNTIPITELTKAATAISEGDLDYKIHVSGQDEVGTLAASFIHLQERLKALISQEVTDAVYRLELEKGRQIQADFLPIQLPAVPNWEISALFEPARSVSGDFYDAFHLVDNYVGLVIGDVCDKGVGAAMFMGLFRSLLRVFSGAAIPSDLYIEHIKLGDEETDIVDNTNPLIHKFLRAVYLTNHYITTEHSSMAMFATLFFGILDSKTGQLTYINAGHEQVYVVNAEGINHRLKSSGLAVGMMPKSTFTSESIQLLKGDLLVGYTDGVTDARCPNGKFFGRKRLEKLLIDHYDDKTQIVERIRKELLEHIDSAVQFDDITMLTVYRCE